MEVQALKDGAAKMAIAQKKLGSMQQLKEDFAGVRSVADLFRLRAVEDAQRVAALRKVAGAWKPLTWGSWPGSRRTRRGASSRSA